jgi:hypothetical protein
VISGGDGHCSASLGNCLNFWQRRCSETSRYPQNFSKRQGFKRSGAFLPLCDLEEWMDHEGPTDLLDFSILCPDERISFEFTATNPRKRDIASDRQTQSRLSFLVAMIFC